KRRVHCVLTSPPWPLAGAIEENDQWVCPGSKGHFHQEESAGSSFQIRCRRDCSTPSAAQADRTDRRSSTPGPSPLGGTGWPGDQRTGANRIRRQADQVRV